MAIADKLTKLATDISSAYITIGTKGGTVPSDKNTDNLATAIDSIPSGGQPTPTGDFRVRFFDIDGTILKEEWVDSGEDATPPANPTYDSNLLTFAEWNNPYTNITADLDIGATYDTKNSENLIIKAKFMYNITKELTLTYVNPTTDGTIDWGDGTTETFPVGGNSSTGATISHTYTKNFGEEVTIKITNADGMYLNGSTSSVFGSFSKNIIALYFGTTYDMNREMQTSLAICTNLKYISLSKTATYMPYYYTYTRSLNTVIIPKSITNISRNISTVLINFITSTASTISFAFSAQNYLKNFNEQSITQLKTSQFQNNASIEYLNLKNVSYFASGSGRNTFYNASILKEIYFENLVSIPSDASIFQGCANLQSIILNKNSIITLSGTYTFQETATGDMKINQDCKIYVPDTLLNSYKTASNWSDIAYRIKPISELPQTSHFYNYVN